MEEIQRYKIFWVCCKNKHAFDVLPLSEFCPICEEEKIDFKCAFNPRYEKIQKA